VTLFRSPLLVLDFETTGFQHQPWSRAIELAAVVLDPTGHEVATFESLILPDILDGRAAGALAVNHITRDMLATAPRTEAVAARFHEWYDGLTEACGGRGPYCTSFNIPFDRVFAERMGLSVRGWASCVMERAMNVMGPAGVLRPGRYGQPWLYPKLSVAAEFFDVAVVGDAHRALTDTRTASGIAKAIASRA
jgi:DNA polymerase III epsilon subunit-like protein